MQVLDLILAGAARILLLLPTKGNPVLIRPSGRAIGVAAAGLSPPRVPPPDRQAGVPPPPLVGDAGGVLPGRSLLAEAADALLPPCWAGAAVVGALA